MLRDQPWEQRGSSGSERFPYMHGNVEKLLLQETTRDRFSTSSSLPVVSVVPTKTQLQATGRTCSFTVQHLPKYAGSNAVVLNKVRACSGI